MFDRSVSFASPTGTFLWTLKNQPRVCNIGARTDRYTRILGRSTTASTSGRWLRAHSRRLAVGGVFSTSMASADDLKKQVGYKAVDDYVRSGMVVGLGTGSTAAFAVERLGQKLAAGALRDIRCVPTSVRTEEQARSLNIPLTTLDEDAELDVAIDGADEVDSALNLVKGRGGALLREKMVEVCAKQFIVIVDESKLVPGLGVSGAMPVEVTPFCWQHTMRKIAALPALAGCRAEARRDAAGALYVTDNGNYIVDLYFEKPIADAYQAAQALRDTVGVVEHGLFLDMASVVIVAGAQGVYEKHR
ncbi:ribose 5-phosphate isomerase [Cyanidioschyzon merolae strain 10D]|jgi:ribose 5-phosphate isomerase A|uniref:ribose-5-phosphate isomerase n=1 Tax=Cyanidioschyzon merolae (strain NIES-3377 / 10D) TaxID=280699 RepID=M1VF90_CYAM1|nr:ribose 5-phosphate isomerase [Cyanidioschyzon merolae strain 10D]BAM81627.1 ribose 5-phosphate isomerase [Cyanidioschyzon merolae strain 10D]|eukprot:XP_005537663.1 ribose 5-phosphate isomerase [Cyanidioschyzon merolae strain 10D]